MVIAQPLVANPTLDSLQAALAACTTTTDRATTLVAIGMEHRIEDRDSAFYYLEQAARLPDLDAGTQGKIQYETAITNRRVGNDSLSVAGYMRPFELPRPYSVCLLLR